MNKLFIPTDFYIHENGHPKMPKLVLKPGKEIEIRVENSYAIKDELKRLGAKYNSFFQGWVFNISSKDEVVSILKSIISLSDMYTLVPEFQIDNFIKSVGEFVDIEVLHGGAKPYGHQ